ncbi:MAG: hypothetical protein FJ189_11550 [Gammaproteobacteria bacterium]|nr:hypothetical protein [Gammaproteobacteria bacterium]
MLSRPILLGALLLPACAPLPVADLSTVSDAAGSQPLIAQQASTPLGGLMFTEYSYWHRSGARILDANRQPFGLGGLFIGKGEVVFPARLGKASVFCSDKRIYSDPIAGFVSKACFEDVNQDGVFESVQVAPEQSNWIEQPLSTPLRYAQMDIPVPHCGSFKYELAYDGYADRTLHLSYREFRGKSLDRPSYTQQARYEIANFPATIVFRNVKIDVARADNASIVYTVRSGF